MREEGERKGREGGGRGRKNKKREQRWRKRGKEEREAADSGVKHIHLLFRGSW